MAYTFNPVFFLIDGCRFINGDLDAALTVSGLFQKFRSIFREIVERYCGLVNHLYFSPSLEVNKCEWRCFRYGSKTKWCLLITSVSLLTPASCRVFQDFPVCLSLSLSLLCKQCCSVKILIWIWKHQEAASKLQVCGKVTGTAELKLFLLGAKNFMRLGFRRFLSPVTVKKAVKLWQNKNKVKTGSL